MITPADLLVRGLGLGPLEDAPEDAPEGTRRRWAMGLPMPWECERRINDRNST